MFQNLLTEPTAPELEAEEPERRAYPTEMLPPNLAKMAKEVSRVALVDEDLPSPLLLAAVSTACGPGLLLSDNGEDTGSNLHFFTTALSGVGKSRTFKKIFSPLFEIELERLSQHATKVLPRINAEQEALAAEKKGLLDKFRKGSDDGDKDSWTRRLTEIHEKLQKLELEATPPQFIFEDATTAAIKKALSARSFVSVCSPDAGDVLENLLGRFADGRADEKIFLSGYSREPVKTNRIGREADSTPEAVTAMALVCTDDMADEIFANKRMKAGGFLARVLFTRSASRACFDDGSSKELDTLTEANWQRIIETLVSYFLDAEEPRFVKASRAASKVFLDARNGKVDAINARNFGAFNARLAEQSKRLAVCLHAAEHLEKAPNVELSEETARAGVELAEWHLSQALEMLGQSEFEADLKKFAALKIAEAKVKKLTVSEARKHGNFQQGEIESLAARRPEWLRIETGKPGKSGGRPSQQIILSN